MDSNSETSLPLSCPGEINMIFTIQGWYIIILLLFLNVHIISCFFNIENKILLTKGILCWQILVIGRGQRQLMHQLDNLTNLLHEYCGERSRQGRTDKASRMIDTESIGTPVILTLAIGGLGVLLFKCLSSQKWSSRHIVWSTPNYGMPMYYPLSNCLLFFLNHKAHSSGEICPLLSEILEAGASS